jgi:hypothetical protein
LLYPDFFEEKLEDVFLTFPGKSADDLIEVLTGFDDEFRVDGSNCFC